MTSKLNPFKKTTADTLQSAPSSDAASTSQQPHSSVGSISNNSNFKSLLDQFGGGKSTSSSVHNVSNSSTNKESPKPNKHKHFFSSSGISIPSISSNDRKSHSNAASENKKSPQLPPVALNRTKSAPISPPVRAMSPPVRPPVHPQSVVTTTTNNNLRSSKTGGRSRSSHDSQRSTSSHSITHKSQARTVLEMVASKYFLPDKRVVYTGVEDYGFHTGSGINGTLGLEEGDGEALLEFLGVDKEEGDVESGSVDSGKSESGEVAPKEVDTTEVDSTPSGKNPKQQTIETSSSIDALLERASEQLSIGKNTQALQSYRSAMKEAYANIIQVKNQLVRVKQEQIKLQYEQNDDPDQIQDNDIELTKQQEREFELLLLQVASRVADIHNNMGVVHEMDRQFHKAQSSYQDALDVYHNTCRRFEQTGDTDVERTHRNVTRMVMACNSEKERKELHSQALRIAKRVDRERTFEGRKKLLNDAVVILQRALEVETYSIGESHPVAASTLISCGKYHYEMREFDLSVMEIRRAVNILCEALGPNHPQVGKAILLLASVYERQGLNISPLGANKDDATLELYVDALEPLKATLTDVHPEVGFLYVKIGYLYSKKGDRNLSALAYKAALKSYGEPWSFASGNVHPEVVSAWVRLTEHLNELKCWKEVLVAGRRALFLLRQARNTLYQDATLASSSVGTGMPSSSSKSSKISPIQITSSTYYDSLLTTLQCLGQAHTSVTEYQLAKMACKEALQLAWEMALANNLEPVDPLKPNNQTIVTSLLRIIRALKRLGKVLLLQKHYSESLECFLPALQLLRSSNEMESSIDAASVLGSLGFLHLKMERFVEASNFFRECLRLYQINGVDQNDRETRKVLTWLAMAEAAEAESASAPPAFLEIPTVIYNDIGQYEL